MKPKPSATIHINPKFRNIHINPMFLHKTTSVPIASTSNIYINPKFLNDAKILQNSQIKLSNPVTDFNDNISDTEQEYNQEPESIVAQIYSNNSRKLVRTPVAPTISTTKLSVKCAPNKPQLVKIGSRKLVRARPQAKPITIPQAKVVRKPVQTKYKIVKEQSTFKIDRRSIVAKMKLTHKRLTLHQGLSGIMELLTSHKLVKVYVILLHLFI